MRYFNRVRIFPLLSPLPRIRIPSGEIVRFEFVLLNTHRPSFPISRSDIDPAACWHSRKVDSSNIFLKRIKELLFFIRLKQLIEFLCFIARFLSKFYPWIPLKGFYISTFNKIIVLETISLCSKVSECLLTDSQALKSMKRNEEKKQKINQE